MLVQQINRYNHPINKPTQNVFMSIVLKQKIKNTTTTITTAYKLKEKEDEKTIHTHTYTHRDTETHVINPRRKYYDYTREHTVQIRSEITKMQ